MLARARVKIRKLAASAGLLSVGTITAILLFLIAAVLFSFLVKEVAIERHEVFDFKVFGWIAPYVSPGMTRFMEGITFFGTHLFLIPANILLTAYFLFVRKHRWYTIKVASIALSSTALMFFLKLYFSRPRPLLPLLKPALGYSFPSGHSLMSFAFYGLLIYLTEQYIGNRLLKIFITVFLLLLIFLIGLSRIYLRVHYASDVLAGFCVGIMWLMLSLGLISRLEGYSQKGLNKIVENPA